MHTVEQVIVSLLFVMYHNYKEYTGGNNILSFPPLSHNNITFRPIRTHKLTVKCLFRKIPLM